MNALPCHEHVFVYSRPVGPEGLGLVRAWPVLKGGERERERELRAVVSQSQLIMNEMKREKGIRLGVLLRLSNKDSCTVCTCTCCEDAVNSMLNQQKTIKHLFMLTPKCYTFLLVRTIIVFVRKDNRVVLQSSRCIPVLAIIV